MNMKSFFLAVSTLLFCGAAQALPEQLRIAGEIDFHDNGVAEVLIDVEQTKENSRRIKYKGDLTLRKDGREWTKRITLRYYKRKNKIKAATRLPRRFARHANEIWFEAEDVSGDSEIGAALNFDVDLIQEIYIPPIPGDIGGGTHHYNRIDHGHGDLIIE